MLRVNTFLCGIKLETGGRIIGWLNVIWNSFVVLILTAELVISSNGGYADLIGSFKYYWYRDERWVCLLSLGSATALIVLQMAYVIGVFVISCFFLKGLNRTNRIYLRPFMVWKAVLTISTISELMSPVFLTLEMTDTLILLILLTLIYVSQFIVAYSIYKQFEDDLCRPRPVYYQAPMQAV